MSYSPQVTGAISSGGNTSQKDIAGSGTPLATKVDPATLTIPVSDTSQFPASGTIRINDEYIIYDAVVESKLIAATRGAFGTIPYAHDAGSVIIGAFVGKSSRTNHPDVMVSIKSSQPGVQYFDYSNDNVQWDTFPTTGFKVEADIHEFHTAIKGLRYFRLRFENASSAKCTDFRAYTFFGVFQTGNLPLNQKITPDADSTVVRAITTGQLPDDTFRQTRADGAAFTTTATLAGTTLKNTLAASETSSLVLTDSSGFPSAGLIQVATRTTSNISNRELIAYSANDASSNTLTIETRGAAPHTHLASNSVVGQVFKSDIISLVGYTQVKTHILASCDGDAYFQFYADADATDPVRGLTVPYLSENGYQLYSAPCFSEHAQYMFANTHGRDQTDFYFSTWCMTKALSGQLLNLNAFIAPAMVANLGRNVIVGKQPDNDFVNLPADGGAFEYTEERMAVGATFESAWWDSDGYNIIELFLSSTNPSSIGGIKIDFTNDVQNHPAPIIRASRIFTFSDYDVDEGFKLLNLPTMLDGFRVSFVNGETQSNVFISATLKTNGATQNFDKSGATQVTDFTTSVALGGVSNYATKNIEGRNGNVFEPADLIGVGGTYDGFQTSPDPIVLYARSSSPKDTYDGVGARTLQICGLPSNTASTYVTQTVRLSGADATRIPGTWWRVIGARVLTAGRAEANVGALTVSTQSAPSDRVYATIQSGENASSNAIYTVPADHRLIIKHIIMTQTRPRGGRGNAQTSLLIRASNGGATGDDVFHPIKRFDIQAGMKLNIFYQGGVIIDEGTDIKARCDAVSGVSTIFCDMEFLLIRK